MYTSADPNAVPESTPPFLERRGYVEIEGLRLYVSETDGAGLGGSSGRALLLIMGIGASCRLWGPLRAALPEVPTIAFDSPGTGASSTPRFPLRMRALANLVVKLLDRQGYREVDVLGVSFGGALAQELAFIAPDRIRRVVLAATGPGLGGVPGYPSALWKMKTGRRYKDPAYLEKIAPDLYGGRVRKEPERVRAMSAALRDAPPLRGYLWQLAAISGWTSMTFLHRITQPTLVIGGDDDPIVPLLNSRILAARIPNAQLNVLRGGGHLFLLDSVELVAPAIREFLDAP